MERVAGRAVTISTIMDARVTSGDLGALALDRAFRDADGCTWGCSAVRRPPERVGFPEGDSGTPVSLVGESWRGP
jgi:hypothetical protein